MLRARASLSRAALVLTLALWASPAAADQPIGGACSGGADTPQSTDGNNVVCIGSVWQYPAYQFGNSSAACNTGSQAGIIRWTGSAFQGCNGSSWSSVGGSAALSSLTAAIATNSG